MRAGPRPNSSRSATTAARQSDVSAATAMNSCVLTTSALTSENTNGPAKFDVFQTVKPATTAIPSVAPWVPNRSAAQISGGNRRYSSGSRVLGGDRAEHDQHDDQRAALEAARAQQHPRGPRPCDGERHEHERPGEVAEPPRAPDHVDLARVDHVARELRDRADRRAHGHAGGERDEDPHHAADAAQRRSPAGQAAQERRGDQDLRHVAGRLQQRGPDRQRAVVVGEQVADEDAGPQPVAAEVDRGDADAGGQPHDRRHRDRRPRARTPARPRRSRRRPARAPRAEF